MFIYSCKKRIEDEEFQLKELFESTTQQENFTLFQNLLQPVQMLIDAQAFLPPNEGEEDYAQSQLVSNFVTIALTP